MPNDTLATILDDVAERAQKALWTATTTQRVYDKSMEIITQMGYTVEVANGKHIVVDNLEHLEQNERS